MKHSIVVGFEALKYNPHMFVYIHIYRQQSVHWRIVIQNGIQKVGKKELLIYYSFSIHIYPFTI